MSELSHSHTESEVKVLLGQLSIEPMNKVLEHPQRLEIVGETLLCLLGTNTGYRIIPILQLSYLKSSFSRENGKVPPEQGEQWGVWLPLLGLAEHTAFAG